MIEFLCVNLGFGIISLIIGMDCRQCNAPCVGGRSQQLGVILVFDMGMSQRPSNLFLIPLKITLFIFDYDHFLFIDDNIASIIA